MIYNIIISSLVKILLGVFVVKYLAWSLGVEGFGLIGQLMTLVAVICMTSGLGVGSGLIKHLSPSQVGNHDRSEWFSVAITLSVLFSCVVFCIVFFGAEHISSRFLSGNFAAPIRVFAFIQFAVGIGTLILAEASSRGCSQIFRNANIVGSLIGALVLTLLVNHYGIDGAAYGVVTMPVIMGFVIIALYLRSRPSFEICLPKFNYKKSKALLSYSGLTLIGAISVPAAQVLMRDTLSDLYGWGFIGIWQALIKISDVYMQLIGVLIIHYALPRFSRDDLKTSVIELKSFAVFISTVSIVGLLFVYFTRNQIITVLFTPEFSGAVKLFVPQLIGDFFRILCSVISFWFVSRGVVKVGLLYEFGQGFLLYLFFEVLISRSVMNAPLLAHVISYSLILFLLVLSFFMYYRRGVK
jgi:O-antigen/teichoic acid export membrane protein